MYSMNNGWNRIIPVCGNHSEEECIEMTVNEKGQFSLFYSCPKYYPENREVGEKACNNRINLIDYEIMVNTLMEKIAKAKLEGNVLDLTNFKWSRKGTDFRVIKHENDKIWVEIKNLRSMKK